MDSYEQFGTHEKISPTSTVHVNCMKHDPIDLIYNFMVSKALFIHIYIVSIWCMTSFIIHIASNKWPYAYDFRHLFAGSLSLYRQLVVLEDRHISLHCMYIISCGSDKPLIFTPDGAALFVATSGDELHASPTHS